MLLCNTSEVTALLSSSLCIILVSLLIRYPLGVHSVTSREAIRERIPNDLAFHPDVCLKSIFKMETPRASLAFCFSSPATVIPPTSPTFRDLSQRCQNEMPNERRPIIESRRRFQNAAIMRIRTHNSNKLVANQFPVVHLAEYLRVSLRIILRQLGG